MRFMDVAGMRRFPVLWEYYWLIALVSLVVAATAFVIDMNLTRKYPARRNQASPQWRKVMTWIVFAVFVAASGCFFIVVIPHLGYTR